MCPVSYCTEQYQYVKTTEDRDGAEGTASDTAGSDDDTAATRESFIGNQNDGINSTTR